MMLRLPVVATAIVAAACLAYWGATQLAAQRKLAALGAPDARGSYRITLDFAPERFHQQRLQDAGRLVEVHERTVYMKDVSPAALHAIAAEYWVHGIERWSAP